MHKLPRSSLRTGLRTMALAAALGLAGTAALADVDAKASRFYEDALQRYQKNDVAGAIIQLKNALKIDKNMLPVHVLLGKALLANSDAIAAEVAFSEALRLGVNRVELVVPLARAVVAQGRPQDLIDQPRFAVAGLPPDIKVQLLLLRAAAAGDLGDTRTGMAAIDEARALDPGNAGTWLAEVPLRIRARQLREATIAADKALALAPTSAEAMYVRGTVAHVQGDLVAAVKQYDAALKAEPTHTEALVSRAGLLLDQGQIEGAARDADLLLRSTPGEPRAAYLKALIAERQGNSTAAKAALNDITGLLDPVPIAFLRYRPQALMLGGLAHYGLNQREKAKPYLEAVLRAQPGSAVAKLLAQIHLADKNTERAIEALDNYLRSQPGDSQAVLLLASAHMAQGRHARASQLIQDALRLNDRPDMRTMLGMSLIGGGKFGDAVAELEAAFKKDPAQMQAGTALATLYMQAGQAAKAVRIAEGLVKLQPKNAGLLNLLGMARAHNGNGAGARKAFEQAVALDARFTAPQINLARLEIDAGAYAAALPRLNAVLALNDKDIDALGELGRLHERRGNLAEAQRWLEKADDHSGSANLQTGMTLVDFHLRVGQPGLAREAAKRLTNKAPEALPVLVSLARVNLANGDAPGARTSLTRAASLADYNPTILLQIALLQLSAGHLPGAAHSLGKALSERPDFLPARALMTEIEIRQGDLGKAELHARQIAAKYPSRAVGHGLLGDLALARGQGAAAIEAYRRAHQLEPTSESLLRLYRALTQSNATGATQLAEQWLKGHPKDVVVHGVLADSHARAGNLAAARNQYEALLKVTPDDPEALNNLANVLLLAKDPGALKVAEQALERRPGAAHIIGTTGWAAFKAGQNDRALQLLRDARLRDPTNRDTRFFLATVLASTGRKAEAREELESALRDGSSFASAKDAQILLGTLR